MNEDNPSVILYDANGVAFAVYDGIAIPVGTPGLLLMGADGANARRVAVDAVGRPIVAGAGTAGLPAGGVLSMQGVVGGVPIPVDVTIGDTITANQGAPGLIGAPWPVQLSDGAAAVGTAGNPVRTDPTGTTTQPISAVALPLPAGAATEVSSAAILAQLDVVLSTRASEATLASIKDTDGIKKITDPLPTGANTIGKVDQGVAGASPWPVDLDRISGSPVLLQSAGQLLVGVAGTDPNTSPATSNPVRIGAIDSFGNVANVKSDSSGRLIVQGIGTPGAPAGGVHTVQGDPAGEPLPISAAALPLPAGAATEVTMASILAGLAALATEGTLASILAQLDVALSTRASASAQTDGTQRAMVEGRAADGAAVVGNPVLIGGQDGVNAQSLLTDSSGRPNVVGAAAQGAAAAGNPLLLAGEDASGNVQRLETTALPPVGVKPGLVVRQVVSQIGTTSTVAASATSVQLLAANTARTGARIVNDSNKLLYVKTGTTASTTDYTKLLGAGEDWFVDAGYIGRLDGIWESANGNARLTEYT